MNNLNVLNVTSDSDTTEDPQRTTLKEPVKRDKSLISFRTASRLAAVQSLYTMDITNKRPSEVIADLQLITPYISDDLPNQKLTDILIPDNFDSDYTLSILYGVVREQRVIDPLINDFLPESWQFKRLDKVTCSILRAAIYELLFSPAIPAKVVINEYTNIASSFKLNQDNSLVNGILNALARNNNLVDA